MAIASLAVRISAQIAEFQKSFKQLTDTTEKFGGDFTRVAGLIEKASGFAGLAKQGIAIAAGMAVAEGAIRAIGSAVDIAIGAVRALATSFTDAIRRTIELGDTLFTLSQKTGQSVESLSALRFIAGQTNTSLDTITSSVFKMQTTLGKGGEATAGALSRLGLSLKELRSADPTDAFTRIITSLGEIPNATQRATIGSQIFGKKFKEIAQLTQEDLGALTAKAKDLGVVMSTETAVAADRFGDAIGELQARAEGFALRVGAAVLPGLIAFVESVNEAFSDLQKSGGTNIEGLAELFDALVVQIGQSAFDLVAKLALVGAELVKLADSFLSVTKVLDSAMNFGFSPRTKAIEDAQSTLRQFTKDIDLLALRLAVAANNAGSNFGATFARIKAEIKKAADEMRRNLKTGVGVEIDEIDKAFIKLRDRISGVELVKTAKEWARALEDPANVVKVFADKTLTKEFVGALDDVVDRFGSLKQAGLESLNGLHKAAKDAIATIKTIPTVMSTAFDPNIGPDGRPRVFNGAPAVLPGATGIFPVGLADRAIQPFKDAFTGLARELPDIITGALLSGNNVIVAAAAGAAQQFTQVFNNAIQRIFKQGGALTAREKAAGLIGTGLQSFVNAFALGQQTTSLVSGGLSGALTGALAGANPALSGATLGASIAIGAGVGLVGGLLGASKGKKQERLALQQAKDAFTAQFGGLEKLRQLADKAGFSLDPVFNAKKPEDFNRAVRGVNEQLAAYNKHLEGLQKATDGVNTRTALFAQQFRTLIDRRKELESGGGGGGELEGINAKIAEVAQRTQPEFERLGIIVRDTFAGLIRESGDAFAAIVALAPSFQVLKQGVTDFGLTSTATIDELLKSFDLVNSEVFGPLLQNVQSSGQVLKGLFDAKALSPEGFQAIAADIGQSLQELANRGGDLSQALALSQPILQTLYEAQQRFGAITDQTTLSILKQAEEQGLVGEHMKSVNEKILDVLVAIAEVFGAVIPDSLKKTKTAAQETADDVERAFQNIDVRTIEIPVDFQWPNIRNDPRFTPLDGVPAFARGGIVTRPTLALIGERGPEAVVPLSGSALGVRRGGGAGDERVRVEFREGAFAGAIIDSPERERTLAKRIAREIRRGGEIRSAWRDAGVRVDD